MLPIKDVNPSGSTPYVTYSLIVTNVLIFLLEAALPGRALSGMLMAFGLVPARVSAVLRGDESLLWGAIIPVFVSMFLHGGWIHLIGNMWYLFIFGDNVEARLGRARFLGFYLFCGLCAGAAQYVLNPSSQLPVIGASGAIAGVLGAYIVCWPHARVVTLLPMLYFITFVELPAVIVLGFWFVVQLFGGTISLGAEFAHGGVAYWAHVGGFVAGVFAIRVLPARKRPLRRYQRPMDWGYWP